MRQIHFHQQTFLGHGSIHGSSIHGSIHGTVNGTVTGGTFVAGLKREQEAVQVSIFFWARSENQRC